MEERLDLASHLGKRSRKVPASEHILHSTHFGSKVFHRELIQELPRKAAENWLDILDGQGELDLANLDAIAEGVKNWAIQQGCTHYTHWFQPLTNICAEKHDAFLAFGPHGTMIEKLRGKEWFRGEPDASSFPSGGLRETSAARGYTVWDPTSFPYLWEGGDGLTLCIPALFFSWSGHVLDHKIPLLRAEAKLNQAVLRLLKMGNVEANRAFSTLGVEQEYFLVDRRLFLARPDLYLAGKTVFGAKPPKGQELEDHYFGAPKDRVMAFMREVEEEAMSLGIPLKTRHNEVAPAQHEVAPLFERASLAIDHNVMLMELMRQIAIKHDLACLFHEKPFQGINGSGKHNNWSIATDTGLNLLEPDSNSLVFLTLLTAILRAVHAQSALLRASIGSCSNDDRLGGSEAPPTILSVDLGQALQHVVDGLLKGERRDLTPKSIDLKVPFLPRFEVDLSDRNRTSFFAFTGNKFEFRAVGSSAHCSLPITVINASVADHLHLILDEVSDVCKDKKLSLDLALPVLVKHLRHAMPVVFGGNNYSEEWAKEAEERKLPNIRNSFHAFSHFLDKQTMRIFQGVLSTEELHSRYEVLVEQYAKTVQIEANLMLDLFLSHILPAAQKDFHLRGIKNPLCDEALHIVHQIEQLYGQMKDFGWEAKAKVCAELILPKMKELRSIVDRLEQVVDNALWPLPKYRELLFLI